ncbi:MAG: AMP-binding protein [Mongoliitalea sp.]
MGIIIIEHRRYSFEDIQTGKFNEADHYFTHALHFCQSWLNSQQTFELQTSGSTGKPKNIQIDRRQMEISAEATKDFFQFRENPTLLCCLNTWFIAGKMMLVRGMEWKASIYLVKPSSNPFLSLARDIPFDLVAMVPLQVEHCLNNQTGLKGLKQTQQLIIGGAPSSESLIKKLLEEKISAFQTYGMTETVSHIALAPIKNNNLVYQTLPGVVIGTDERQCLWIEAPMAKEVRLQTNDIVSLFTSHTFKWLGRADFTINTGGIKVQPEQVEKVIEELIHKHLGEVAFFVGGVAEESLGQAVVLIIEKKDAFIQEKELLKKLADILPKYHHPKEIKFLETFVRTDTGKINRHQTLELLCSKPSSS